MMMDPAKMSGIPRPDGQVSSGTVTVRLIRGELQNRIINAAVELFSISAPNEAPRFEKTDDQGRATFADLPAATYQARATVDGQSLISEPIPVAAAPAPGMRVMLVFPRPDAAPSATAAAPTPEGTAAPAAPAAPTAPTVPSAQKAEISTVAGTPQVLADAAAGTLTVKALDIDAKPLAGLRVVVVYARRVAQKVEVLPPQFTAADGTVHYNSLETGPDLGYMAFISRDGREHRSQPFHLDKEHGSLLALTVPSVVLDIGALRIGQGSHIVFDLQDDTVQVIENLILENPLNRPVDPGPSGLRIALAADALSPQVSPESPPGLSIDVTQPGAPAMVYKGIIAPGRTMLDVAFVLKHHGSLVFRQPASLRYEGLRIGVAKLPDLQIDGVTDLQERKLSGRDFLMGTAFVPSVGGFVEVSLHGLPSDFYLLRILAAFGALAIAATFAYLAIYTRDSEEDAAAMQKQRQKLLNRRETLLSELLKHESAGAAPRTKLRPAEEIRTELEAVYRKLDESDG